MALAEFIFMPNVWGNRVLLQVVPPATLYLTTSASLDCRLCVMLYGIVCILGETRVLSADEMDE